MRLRKKRDFMESFQRRAEAAVLEGQQKPRTLMPKF